MKFAIASLTLCAGLGLAAPVSAFGTSCGPRSLVGNWALTLDTVLDGASTVQCEIAVRRTGALQGICFGQRIAIDGSGISVDEVEFPASGTLAIASDCQVSGTLVVGNALPGGLALRSDVAAVAWGAASRAPVAMTGLATAPFPGLSRPATGRLVGHRAP